MIDRESLLRSLQPLRNFVLSSNADIEKAMDEAYRLNPWFIPEFSRQAIHAVAEEYLDETKFASWLSEYPNFSKPEKNIGIIMAGNVPLVGFHDLICVLASGHKAIIKLSEKDATLTKCITDKWITINPALSSRIQYQDKLQGYDAVIATGSNNSSRYFEYYFRNHPHILRRNRNGVAVLTGHESMAELKELAKDIFLYFGLGCRNVSKIYVPDGYDFQDWKEAVSEWEYLADHTKYRHNLDYNYAIYIINQVPHIQLGHLILKEDDSLSSRIGCVHFSYYENEEQLSSILEEKRSDIQCLVSGKPWEGWVHVAFGQSQLPSLDQYADGVDTMSFLLSLDERH